MDASPIRSCLFRLQIITQKIDAATAEKNCLFVIFHSDMSATEFASTFIAGALGGAGCVACGQPFDTGACKNEINEDSHSFSQNENADLSGIVPERWFRSVHDFYLQDRRSKRTLRRICWSTFDQLRGKLDSLLSSQLNHRWSRVSSEKKQKRSVKC